MGNINQKEWLIAYVQMHHERKVRDCLDNMGIENYLPVQHVVRQWSDRKKVIEQIVIPMIIFVRVSQSERKTVLTTPSVFRYMTLRGTHQPAVVSDKEMQTFQFMLDSSESAVNMESEIPEVGEQVRVIKGPLQGLEGTMIAESGKKSRIAVQLNQLGFATVELAYSFVEKIG